MQGKVIIVTGGFGTLGQAVAAAVDSAGACVALIDFAPALPKDSALKLSTKMIAFGGVDLTKAEDAQAAIAKVKTQFQRVDALINVAGGFRWELIAENDTGSWDALYAMNVKTALNAAKAALPYLLESGSGRIVNVGANAAVKAATGMGPYAASKAAVHRLTESLAEEMKGRGITVNAVLPSIIDTPLNRADMPTADFKKWVAPADLAAVILFLASDAAKAVTGALLPVTGEV